MKNKRKVFGVLGIILVLSLVMLVHEDASAFSVTPMKQAIDLTPGSSYVGQVSAFVMNEANGGEKMYYEASIAPLVVKDENNQYYGVFDEKGERNDIVYWTTISDGDEISEPGGKVYGSIDVGEKVEFSYKITVPEDAKGGGQYFAVRIKSIPDPDAEANSQNIGIVDYISIASVVYANVAGDITTSGSISEGGIPGFLLAPPITTSFVAKNDGNIHTEIKYYLQVFPLFSDEEIYSTEDTPSTEYVLPETSRFITQTWDDTPSIGIFKVRQTAYYDFAKDDKNITEKIVIICPIWLLFIVIFAIAALIIWLVMRAKARRQKEED